MVTGRITECQVLFHLLSARSIFSGISAQIIGDNSATTFIKLNINNSTGVNLQTNANTTGKLTLTSGLVTTSGNTVLTAVGNITVNSSSSYINGNKGGFLKFWNEET